MQPAQPSLTVRDILTLYLRHSAANSVHGPAARKEREYTLGLFADECGHIAVSECKPFHLTDFIEARPDWRSSATRRQKSNGIRAAFNWAVDQERIERNPFRRVRYSEAERRPDMPDEVLTRIECLANKPFDVTLRFLRLTGVRVSELCDALWQDMDLERGTWTIHHHKSRKHTRKPKIVALVADAVSILRSVQAARGEGPSAPSIEVEAGQVPASAYVFLNTRGKPWTRKALAKSLERIKARFGIRVRASLHGIRHRFGSAAVAAGAPIKLVSMQMGHATVAVTERYYVDLANEVEAIRAAAEKAVPRAAS